MNQPTTPESIGFSSPALQQAYSLLQKAVDQDQVPGAALQVSRRGHALPTACFGRRQIADDGAALKADTIFLIASITKPIVCAAIMRLVEQGRLRLDDTAASLLPSFDNRGKEAVTIRHLLTHTSGLPDMLPENHRLRAEHQPLAEFVKRICQLELLFEPGTQISYQSCGIAVLGAIVEELEQQSLPQVLRRYFFDPLALADTSLGRQPDRSEREAQIRLPPTSDSGGDGTDWHWNSDYWRHFSAPWGGMLTTASELTVLCRAFLFGGTSKGTQILSPAATAAMIRDQTSSMTTLPQAEKSRQRWGLGWQLNNGASFGDLTSAFTFGHGGATGTVAWIDPATQVTFVLLTNDPQGAAQLRPRVSNAVAAAIM